MISILVPTSIGVHREHNNIDYLKLFLDSVVKNTTVPYEILIWDNGTTNNEVKELCESKNYRYFRSNENLGIAAPYNAMAYEAQYDTIFLSDDDFYMMPGWDKLLDEIDTNGWVAPLRIEMRSDKGDRGIKMDFGDINDINVDILENCFKDYTHLYRIHQPFLSTAIKKQDFFDIGGFNDRFKIGEQDFLWRSFNYYKRKDQIQLAHPQSLVYHFGSKTRRPVSDKGTMFKYCEDTYGISITDMDKEMRHFHIVGKSLDDEGNLIQYRRSDFYND